MVSPRPDIAMRDGIAAKYGAFWKSIPGIKSVYLGGAPDGKPIITLIAMNPETADFIRPMLASEINGVPIIVGSPGYGALKPPGDQIGLPGVGPGGHAGEPPDGPVLEDPPEHGDHPNHW